MMTGPNPRRGEATKSETGKSCPFCRFPVKEKDEVTFCGVCESPHHNDCWDENQGCAVVDCAGGPSDEIPEDPADRGASARPHVPPPSAPDGKKERSRIESLSPEPPRQPRRRPRQRPRTAPPSPPRPPAPPVAASEGSSNRGLFITGAVVLFVALVGVFLIAQSFGDDSGTGTDVCAPGTGVNGIPCADNGKLPNISDEQMKSEITAFIRSWYGYLTNEDYGTAFSEMSVRKRKQIKNDTNSYPRGVASWRKSVRGMTGHLDPRKAKVTFMQPSYPDEGVMTINVTNMPYDKTGDKCGNRVGVTWVQFDPEENQWFYEPGANLTTQRQTDWGSQPLNLLQNRCVY